MVELECLIPEDFTYKDANAEEELLKPTFKLTKKKT
jgi:hypothetical protein